MGNPFELRPVDFLGTANQWRQDLARTAQMESQARQGKQTEESNQLALMAEKKRQADEIQFQADIDALPQASTTMDKMAQIADLAMGRGRLVEAQKALASMAQIDARAQSIEQRQALADERTQKATASRLEIGQKLLAGVSDEAGFKNALEQYRTVIGDDEWHKYMQGQKYSPELVKNAQGFLTKQRDAAQIKVDEERAAQLARQEARQRRLDAAQIRLIEAQTRLADRKARDDEKAGGEDAISKIQAGKNANMYNAASDVAIGLEEILKLPVSGMGALADVAYSHDPTIIGSMKKWFANAATPDEEHMYATRLAGLAVAATRIANSGDVPRISQVEAEQRAIAGLKGQSRRVYFDKINQTALKALNSLENTIPGKGQEELLENNKVRLRKLVDETDSLLAMMHKKGKKEKPATPSAPVGVPSGVPADVWGAMTPEEKALWNK